MATLVQFLAAGVKGAEGGSAEFRIRGTVSSAASVLWEQFEEETQPGQNIFTLDSNGALEMYCDALCDVILRNAAGAILRTVTIGNSAPLVEVRSAAFTGTAYDGDPANTAGEPTTLQSVLDRWLTSAGAVDWQVLVDGSAVDIQTAFASVATTFINVKAPVYGATGGGVTDDTTAILSACSDAANAGGGIVFFPPGTYRVNGLSVAAPNIVLMGCGAGASILRSDSVAELLAFSDTSEDSSKRVTGLGFSASASVQALIQVRENQNLSIDNCGFVCTNVTDSPIRRNDTPGFTQLTVSNCVFTELAENGIRNESDPGESNVCVDNCTFTATAVYTGAVIQGPNFAMSRCLIDCSAIEGNAHYHVIAGHEGRHLGAFTGNTFVSNGAANGYAFGLTSLAANCDFSESDNLFIGFQIPFASEELGTIYDISTPSTQNPGRLHLGSRKGRLVHIENTEATFLASACLVAETVVILHGAGDDLDVSVPALIPGLSGRVVVEVLTGSGSNEVNFFGEQPSNLSRAIITAGTVIRQGMLATTEGTEICSCGYVTMAAVGGYASLITGIVDHSVAV